MTKSSLASGDIVMKKLLRNLTFALATTVGTANADQIVPIIAHSPGAANSTWRSDLKLYNPSDEVITGKLVGTPRGQSQSETDPNVTFTLQPKQVTVFEDVYATIHGQNVNGADRVLIQIDTGTDPIADTATYNLNPDGGELGQNPAVFKPTEFYGPNTTLAGIIGKNTERTNTFVMTGSDGATITWKYRQANGADEFSITQNYVRDATIQLNGTASILGFEALPNSSLEATINSGSARIGQSPVNNISNQGRWTEYKKVDTISNEDAAILYVNKWLPTPDTRFYLSNTEIRAMINGGRTRSYALDLAQEFYKDPRVQSAFENVDAVKQWLLDRTDGNPNNSELCSTYDPFLWTANVATTIYDGSSCGPVDFEPNNDSLQNIYLTVKEFLVQYVQNNPSLYGGEVGGIPLETHDPTWNLSNPN